MSFKRDWRAAAFVWISCASACQLVAGLQDRTVAVHDASTPLDAQAETTTEGGGCDMCNGTCVELSTDPQNCGFCGHVCHGNCGGGLCPAIDLVTTFEQATALAMDAANLYVSDALGVHAIAKSTNTATLISSTSFPQSVTASGGRVFVSSPFAILNMATDGSDVQTIFSRVPDGGTPANGDIIADSQRVYFTTIGFSSGLLDVTLDGGMMETIVAEDGTESPAALGVDQNVIYYTTGMEIRSVMRDGSNDTHLAGSLTGTTRLAIGTNAVFWGDQVRLYSLPLDGGVLQPLVTEDVVTDVTIYGGNLYFTSYGLSTNTGAILMLPIGGGAAVRLANANDPGRVVADASFVYWLENINQTTSALRKVAR